MTTTTPTPTPESTLEAAQRVLAGWRQAADLRGVRGPQISILSGCEDVVDHVRRITLPTASAHYQADKSGPLVAAALRIQTATLLAYGEDCGTPPDALDETLATVAEHLEAAVTASRAVGWDLARCGTPSTDSVAALRESVFNLSRLCDQLAAVAHTSEG